ncbi:lasso peptide biosynthesis B2 protein [Caenimonas aquaedulcis]|uniref:Lasso peptide biosynthesis B2 protein n=1 Tax=Caenimonas aquaedulcis TaxID=2793270 RepID=A0A931H5L9_9BURK|nr:lasso peptide biosynthesis B2 protein [Caenimonas aquaedulcis]MBG9389080.1 lasso peptide biosynthesis B2 protein [Caenimonas aquaedulcis]
MFLQALFMVPWMVVVLRIAGVRRALAHAAVLGPRSLDEEADVVRAAQRVVAAAARHGVVRGSCLPTSLALQRLLGRRGIATRLRIGASTDAGAFSAHAWVEWRGRPLIDGAGVRDRFHAFGDLPGPALPRER